MADIIVVIILFIVISLAVRYIWKEKRNGRKCAGCPYSGSDVCHNMHSCDKQTNEKTIE